MENPTVIGVPNEKCEIILPQKPEPKPRASLIVSNKGKWRAWWESLVASFQKVASWPERRAYYPNETTTPEMVRRKYPVQDSRFIRY